MMRLVIYIDNQDGDKIATKETVAMALEQFGKVRVAEITDGTEKRR